MIACVVIGFQISSHISINHRSIFSKERAVYCCQNFKAARSLNLSPRSCTLISYEPIRAREWTRAERKGPISDRHQSACDKCLHSAGCHGSFVYRNTLMFRNQKNPLWLPSRPQSQCTDINLFFVVRVSTCEMNATCQVSVLISYFTRFWHQC